MISCLVVDADVRSFVAETFPDVEFTDGDVGSISLAHHVGRHSVGLPDRVEEYRAAHLSRRPGRKPDTARWTTASVAMAQQSHP